MGGARGALTTRCTAKRCAPVSAASRCASDGASWSTSRRPDSTGKQQLNAAGESESIYLERLEHLVKRGRCPADAIIEKWIGEWGQDISRLIAGSSYRIAA